MGKIPVIGKLAGETWAKLSAEEKAPFEKRAEEAKSEYTKALAEWKASNPGGGEGENDDAEGDDDGKAEAAESPPKKPRKADSPKSGTPPKAKAKGKAAIKKNASNDDEIEPGALKL